MAIKKTNTATLIRGQTYTLRHPDHKPQAPKEALRFERGIPVVVEDLRILGILQNMVEEIEDGEGEVYEKPVFRVDRGVDAPDETRGPRRLSATRTVKRRIVK
jgi:hypothetical protein